MTWTAPATAVTGNTLTAAFWNAQVRDNMLETAAATATTAGDIVYADAANSMGSRVGIGSAGSLLASTGTAPAWRTPAEDTDWSDATVSGIITTSSYSSVNSDGGTKSLPSVTITTGTKAIVIVSASGVFNSTTGSLVFISYSVSGASTVAASDDQSAQSESDPGSQVIPPVSVRLQTLTAGSNTFQMQARVNSGTGTISRPRILVIPL